MLIAAQHLLRLLSSQRSIFSAGFCQSGAGFRVLQSGSVCGLVPPGSLITIKDVAVVSALSYVSGGECAHGREIYVVH
jgi:hypothetical protein